MSEWTEQAVRHTLANLPEHARTMLAELDASAQDWHNANHRTRSLFVAFGIPLETAAEVDRQMTDTTIRDFDVAAFHGAAQDAQLTPQQVHALLLDAHGANTGETPEREKGSTGTDLPQIENGSQSDHGPDENASQPTPVQRRDAWLLSHVSLVRQMEDRLAAVRGFLPYASRPSAMVNALAEEWAVLQLLKTLRDMPAPVVPVDDTVGQATLEEAVDAEVWRCHGCGNGPDAPHGPGVCV